MTETQLPSPPPKARKSRWGCVGAAAATVFVALFILPFLSRLAPRDARRILEIRARVDVEIIAGALKEYEVEYGAMLEGDPALMLAALQGANPSKIMFLKRRSEPLGPQGEWLDPWGSPYQIGISEKGGPWAYSLGPDRKDSGGAAGTDDFVSW